MIIFLLYKYYERVNYYSIKMHINCVKISSKSRRRDTGNVLSLKFDNRRMHSNIKSNDSGLFLLIINLVGHAWVRVRSDDILSMF